MNLKDTIGKIFDPQLETKGPPAGQPMADEWLRKAVKKVFAGMWQRVEQQQREIAELQKQVGELNSLKREIDSLNNTILLLTERPSTPIPGLSHQGGEDGTQAPMPMKPAPVPTLDTSTPESKPVFPQEFFAKTVDCFRPVGFVSENLRTSDEGCVFKVVLSDNDNGTFELVDNFEMRQVMLAAFAPLVTETSEYSDLPLAPLDINTIDKGTLRREGAILVITKKQTVKIV